MNATHQIVYLSSSSQFGLYVDTEELAHGRVNPRSEYAPDWVTYDGCDTNSSDSLNDTQLKRRYGGGILTR